MNILQFALRYKRLLIFGVALTFFSNFGQTFLISLFVPDFLKAFAVTNAWFGTLYSLATLSSAMTLVWIGSKIDRFPLKSYALMVAGGLVLSALVLAISQWVWMLFLGLYGIRLFGQGLSAHTAHTTMARYFVTMRGKAISVANLGFTLGEALLPITITSMIATTGWRAGWTFISIFVILVLPAIIVLTLGKDPSRHGENKYRIGSDEGVPEPGNEWRRSKILKDYRFYLFLPGIIISPFLLTGMFLYQTHLAGYKGWDIEILASAFVAFAVGKSVFSLVAGPLVDRFKACRLFPFFLIPFFAALLFLSLSSHYLTVFVYLFLAGMSEGIASNVKTSLYAELYGTAHLGTIRSMMSMLIVISTAVSPVLFGYLLDIGITFGSIIYGSMSIMLISIFMASFIYREAKHTVS